MSDPRIIVALDFPGRSQAQEVVARLDPAHCRVKVGKELFTCGGPELVTWLVNRGFKVFLDLKFHDIPNTVAGACEAAASLGAWMITVHASGGRDMLGAAVDALKGFRPRPLLVGVTVLTSLSSEDLKDVGVEHDVPDQVLRLGRLSMASGLDGLVCSALEAPMLRHELGPCPILVTPGIRPAGTAAGDQQRVTTPADAIRAGSSYLVVGRPITRAADPLQALLEIETAAAAGDPES